MASLSLFAQPDRKQKFAAAGYVGLNLSQIDGDYYFGYNKVGIRFGIETQYLIKPKYFVSLGIGYTQGGARPNRSERNDRNNNAINLRLNMIEIPLLLHYRLGNKEQFGKRDNFQLYRSGTLQFGMIFNRLTSFNSEETGRATQLPTNQNFIAVSDQFRDWDLKIVVGATIRTSLSGALFVQHNRSILGLYQPETNELGQVLPLYPYSLTLGYRHVLY